MGVAEVRRLRASGDEPLRFTAASPRLDAVIHVGMKKLVAALEAHAAMLNPKLDPAAKAA